MTRRGIGVGALALAMAAYAAVTGPLLIPGCDAWHHLAQVQRVIATGGWLPRGPHGELEPNAGIWYAVLALACRVTGAPPLAVWVAAGSFVAGLAALAAVWMSRELLGPDRDVAGGLAFFLLFEGTHLNPWRELAYPRYANLVPLFIAIGAAVRFVERGRARDLMLAAACGAVLAAVHLVEFALFGVLLGYFAISLAVLSRPAPLARAARALSVGVATLACALPYLWGVVYRQLPELVANVGGGSRSFLAYRDVIVFSARLWMLDPAGEAGAIITPAGLGAALCAGLLMPRARTHAGTALIVGGLLGVPLTLFVPPVLPLFLKIWPTPEVLHRVALVMMVPWAVVALERIGTARVIGATGPRGRLLGALALAPLVLSLPVALERYREAEPRRWLHELAPFLGWGDLTEFLATRYPKPVGVLADPVTGAFIAAMTGHYSIDSGTSNDPNPDRRVLRPWFALLVNPTQSSADALGLLKGTGTRVVVHNQRSAGEDYAAHAYKDPYDTPEALAFLKANPAVFKPVFFTADGVWVFEVQPDHAGPLAGKDVPAAVRKQPILARPPEGEEPRWVGEGLEVFVPKGGLSLRARRGGMLDFTLAWRFARPRDDFVKIRFHAIDSAYRGRFYAPEYGKLYRKCVEWWEGRLYRFGGDSELVPEAFQPLAMEAGDVVEQRLRGPLYERYAPGTWELRVEVVPKFAPERGRSRIADDAPGTAVGTLTIE